MTEYYQLAHNERHPETRKPVARIIHNFGRADQLDRDELGLPFTHNSPSIYTLGQQVPLA